MRLLSYQGLDLRRHKAAFDKVRKAIEADDFKTPNVKKLNVGPYYRAKLDDSNRLLLQFVQHQGQTVCLALELIAQHAYDKSRFLRGAVVQEDKIEREPAPAGAAALPAEDVSAVRWLHPKRPQFELLDKPIQFDDVQQAVLDQPLPWVLVGSAGSGKTAVTLSRLREMRGQVLYLTQSAYLAQAAQDLYHAHGYHNERQEVVFLSFQAFLETWRVPPGKPLSFAAFVGWHERHRAQVRALGLDAHSLLEEFRGVIAAQPGGALSAEQYLERGQRQSLLTPEQREQAYPLFLRYREWLREAGWYDTALLVHEWRALIEPTYDHVVVDEVQDLTAAQVEAALATLKTPGQFLLCGDANQIVHPNFFSWAALRELFWKGHAGEPGAAALEQLHILQANFRNTEAVTELANRLLKIKQARFGSIDRESNHLVQSRSDRPGEVTLLAERGDTLQALDKAVRASARHAVLVLRDEDKAAARAVLKTPLVFSVHEAKGLEYPHVILLGMVSGARQAYATVCEGVGAEALAVEALQYRRGRDKADKSLERYKFYVNALYVAMTRAVETLTLVEADLSHPLLGLLGLREGVWQARAPEVSSQQEWAQEARRLEMQGKTEQAQAIRDTILREQPVPWQPWGRTAIEAALPQALQRQHPSTKLKQLVMDYALWHDQTGWVDQLARAGFAPAAQLAPEGVMGLTLLSTGYGDPIMRADPKLPFCVKALRAQQALQLRQLTMYAAHGLKPVLQACERHGLNHATPTGATPLMMAARAGNTALVDALLTRGANPELRDEFGHTAWMHALSRAIEDEAFGQQHLAALAQRLAPAFIDVQTGERLHRITQEQGEYWPLSIMLVWLKTGFGAGAVLRDGVADNTPYVLDNGFTAEALETQLERLPVALWSEPRRKRSYLNHVMARAEIDSSYQPSRQLWMRLRQGLYLPNPWMRLRVGDDWQWLHEALHLDWVDAGTSTGYRPVRRDGLANHINSQGPLLRLQRAVSHQPSRVPPWSTEASAPQAVTPKP